MENNTHDFQKYFKDRILSAERLERFGNNRGFAVSLPEKKYFVKRYSTFQKDGWNRGKTEFRALSLLWNRGFRDIPKPIAFYDTENIGIYSFEEGKNLSSGEVKAEDILKAVDFLARVHSLGIEDKRDYPLERTCCLSIQDCINLIEVKIKSIQDDFCGGADSRRFLYCDVASKIDELKQSISKRKGAKLNASLSLEEQVITPGDFGFHNMLVSPGNPGKYVFVDFEYCGVDDPVKQVLEFLHDDRTRGINDELKNLFLSSYKEKVCLSKEAEERMRVIDPLIGMHWLLIYLKVVSKNYLEYLRESYGDIGDFVEKSLSKARDKLNNLAFFK